MDSMTRVARRVSVIIPSYSHVAYLRTAVRSALDQDYDNIEVIVVDDGSLQDVQAALSEFDEPGRLSYVRQPNAGAAVARNTGRAHANGEYLAYLDEDDYWDRTKVSRQVAAIERHPEVGAVFCNGFLMAEDGRCLGLFQDRKGFSPKVDQDEVVFGPRTLTLSDLLNGIVITSSILIRADAVDAVRGFALLPAGQDIDFSFRVHEKYALAYIPAPLFYCRMTAASISRSGTKTLESTLCVLDYLDRYALLPGERLSVRAERGNVERALGEEALDAGNHREARQHFARSLAAPRGLDARTLLLLCASLLPSRAIPRLRNLKEHFRRDRSVVLTPSPDDASNDDTAVASATRPRRSGRARRR